MTDTREHKSPAEFFLAEFRRDLDRMVDMLISYSDDSASTYELRTSIKECLEQAEDLESKYRGMEIGYKLSTGSINPFQPITQEHKDA